MNIFRAISNLNRPVGAPGEYALRYNEQLRGIGIDICLPMKEVTNQITFLNSFL